LLVFASPRLYDLFSSYFCNLLFFSGTLHRTSCEGPWSSPKPVGSLVVPVDAELQANLNKARSGRMMFAFAHKGNGGSLVVNRTINGQSANKVKESSGGGTLFRGQCFGENGEMIFEVAKEPPAALAAAIKQAIVLHAGLSLKVVVRVAGDAEIQEPNQEPPTADQTNGAVPEAPPSSGEAAFKSRLIALQAQFSAAGGATPEQRMLLKEVFAAAAKKDLAAALARLDAIETPKQDNNKPDTPTAAVSGEQFKARLKALLPAYNAATKADPSLLAKLQPSMAQVIKQGNANQFDLAWPALLEIEKALAAAVPPAPTVPPTNGAELMKRLGALAKDIKTAMAGPNKAQVQVLVAAVNDLLKKKDFDKAGKVLDALERLVKQGKPAAPVSPGAELEQQWLARFAKVEPSYQAVLKTQPANASDLRATLASAQASAEKGDFAGALAALTRLEALIEEASTLGKETDVIPEGIVKQTVDNLEKAAGSWRDAHFTAIEGLGALIKQLRADDDPDLHDIADRVNVLTKDIPSEIEAALAKLSAAIRKADGREASKLVKEVQAGVDKCERFIKDNLPYIERCEDNPFNLPVKIEKPMRETLASIRASLPNL
jgi:hypothetical protein